MSSSVQTDLFEIKIEEEATRKANAIVAKQLKEYLNDPVKILEFWQKDSQLKQKEINRLKPKAEKYDRFLDSDGYIDAAEASSVIRLEYISPDGKTQIMGRNYFMKVLVFDKFLIPTANGYRFYSEHEKSGIGITRAVTRNGYIKSVCLFNADGLEKLMNKYQNDTRVFYSNSDHGLYWE